MQLLLDTYMPELERLKMDQDLLKQQYAPVHHSDTVQITTSNLPELSNWGSPTPAPRVPQVPPQRPEDDLSRLSLLDGDLLSSSVPAFSSAPPPVRSHSLSLLLGSLRVQGVLWDKSGNVLKSGVYLSHLRLS